MSPRLQPFRLRMSRPAAVGLLLALMAPPACSGGGQGGGGGGGGGGSGAPTPPPPESLSLNLSVSAGGLDLDATQPQSGTPSVTSAGGNYLLASDDILAVNTAIAAPLTLPVALLRAAQTQPAALRDTATWVRGYDVGNAGLTWTVNLQSLDDGTGTLIWSLRITSAKADAAGCCQDFELLTGQSGPAGGSWQLHNMAQPSLAPKLFDIVYALKDAAKTLAFHVSPDLPAAERLGGGSTITYKLAGTAAELDVDDSSSAGERVIKWDSVNAAGSETQPGAQPVCWGNLASGYADVACP